MDFAYRWSSIGKGLRMQPAQQACLNMMIKIIKISKMVIFVYVVGSFKRIILHYVFNRPGEAGAVLQSALLLIYSVTESAFSS